jgi:hypothetical protein
MNSRIPAQRTDCAGELEKLLAVTIRLGGLTD